MDIVKSVGALLEELHVGVGVFLGIRRSCHIEPYRYGWISSCVRRQDYSRGGLQQPMIARKYDQSITHLDQRPSRAFLQRQAESADQG